MLRLFEDADDSEDMVVASRLVVGDSVRCVGALQNTNTIGGREGSVRPCFG